MREHTIGTFDVVCGGALLALGTFVYFTKRRSPGLAVRRTTAHGSAISTDVADGDARTQRTSGASVAILGACILADGLQPTRITFSFLGWAALFTGTAIEYGLELFALQRARVPLSEKTVRNRKLLAATCLMAACFALVCFVLSFLDR